MNEIICNTLHDFVKEHINEVKDSYENLGFKDAEDILYQIKNDIQVAVWALQELLDWGMSKNYTDLFVINPLEDTYPVYKIGDCFFKVKNDWDSVCYKVVPVKKVTKTIKVTEWEEIL